MTLDVDAKVRLLGYRLISIDIPEDLTAPIRGYATRHKSRGGGTFQVQSDTIAGVLMALCFPTMARRLGGRK